MRSQAELTHLLAWGNVVSNRSDFSDSEKENRKHPWPGKCHYLRFGSECDWNSGYYLLVSNMNDEANCSRFIPMGPYLLDTVKKLKIVRYIMNVRFFSIDYIISITTSICIWCWIRTHRNTVLGGLFHYSVYTIPRISVKSATRSYETFLVSLKAN